MNIFLLFNQIKLWVAVAIHNFNQLGENLNETP